MEFAGSPEFSSLLQRFPRAAIEYAGALSPKSPLPPAERLSIGCETLDRDYWEFDRGLESLKELSPGWARIQSGWDKCEKTPGVYDFEWLDHIVESLCALHIRPWMCVCFGNKAYYGEDTYIRKCPITFNAEITGAWERYLETLASRYKGKVSHFEIWNEPDLCWGIGKLENIQLYTEFVKCSAAALRKGNRNAFILGGAFACGPRNTTRHHGYALADQFFKNGAGTCINAYSYHSYDVFPELVQAPELAAMKRVFKRYGVENMPLWQGEGGCPAAWQKDNALSKHPWNDVKQARHLLRNMLCDLRNGAEVSSYFMLSDFTYKYADGTLGPCHYGLLAHPNYRRRPSFYAYKSLCELFNGRVELDEENLFSLHKTDDQRQMISIEDSAGVDAPRVSIQRFTFKNREFPLFAWYRIVNPHRGEPLFLSTVLCEGPQAEMFKDPYLLDPVTRTLWRCEKVRLDEQWGSAIVRIDDLPTGDYPLFLVPGAFLKEVLQTL